MKNTLARSVSILFHPLLIPTLVLAFAYVFAPAVMGLSGAVVEIRFYILLFVVFYTAILPGSFILWLSKRKIISGYSLSNLRDRRIPYLSTAIIYGVFAYVVYTQSRVLYATSLFLFCTAVVILILGLISFWWQISAHAAGAGGWLGFLLLLLIFQENHSLFPFVLSLPLIGAILSARLQLQVHTPAQVWAGFAIGVLTQILGWLLFR